MDSEKKMRRWSPAMTRTSRLGTLDVHNEPSRDMGAVSKGGTADAEQGEVRFIIASPLSVFCNEVALESGSSHNPLGADRQ
jgi:hypothetical protein